MSERDSRRSSKDKRWLCGGVLVYQKGDVWKKQRGDIIWKKDGRTEPKKKVLLNEWI